MPHYSVPLPGLFVLGCDPCCEASDFTGAGSLVATAVLAGTGTITSDQSGTGDLIATAVLAGSGAISTSLVIGSGNLIATATLSGTGTLTNSYSGTGALLVSQVLLAGVGSNATVSATGELNVSEISLAGSGLAAGPNVNTGTGSLAVGQVLLAGVGIAPGNLGTGALAVSQVLLAGIGQAGANTGTGSLNVAQVLLAGTGQLIGPYIGSGALAVAQVLLAGVGTVPGIIGTGAVSVDEITLDGTAEAQPPATFSGTGAVTVATVTLSGAGLVDSSDDFILTDCCSATARVIHISCVGVAGIPCIEFLGDMTWDDGSSTYICTTDASSATGCDVLAVVYCADDGHGGFIWKLDLYCEGSPAYTGLELTEGTNCSPLDLTYDLSCSSIPGLPVGCCTGSGRVLIHVYENL